MNQRVFCRRRSCDFIVPSRLTGHSCLVACARFRLVRAEAEAKEDNPAAINAEDIAQLVARPVLLAAKIGTSFPASRQGSAAGMTAPCTRPIQKPAVRSA